MSEAGSVAGESGQVGRGPATKWELLLGDGGLVLTQTALWKPQ